MNSLSWFLYFADVLPTIGVWLSVFGMIGALFYILLMPPKDIAMFSMDHTGPFLGISSNARTIVGLLALFFIGLLVPTKETIYLIAASEAGETVVESKEGQKVLNDIQEIINLQLQRLKETK